MLDLSGESTSPTSMWGRRSCSKTDTFLIAQLLWGLIIWLLLETFLACFRLSFCKLTGCKLPGSLEKTLSLKWGTLTAQDKHLLPCTEAAAGAEPPPMSPSHDRTRRKRTAPYRMGYTQPSCHSEPWVTLGDTTTCIWEEGLNPPCLWFL